MPPQVVAMRALLALLLPPLAATAVAVIAGSMTGLAAASSLGTSAILLAAMGVVSLFMGLRWYGTRGLGLRGGRALFAGIGFAVLGWVIFAALRLYFIPITAFGLANETRNLLYLLLFEAFATQLWTFGLLFRALADWRGGLTAAIMSGIVFGLTATVLFQEAYVPSGTAVLYFVAWGILYGVIRLRTGSILGMVLVQAAQSFTAWVVLTPPPPEDLNLVNLSVLYVGSLLGYALVTWRLWPKREDDYRI